MNIAVNKDNSHHIGIHIDSDGAVKFRCDSGLSGTAICCNCREFIEVLFVGFVLGLKLP